MKGYGNSLIINIKTHFQSQNALKLLLSVFNIFMENYYSNKVPKNFQFVHPRCVKVYIDNCTEK